MKKLVNVLILSLLLLASIIFISGCAHAHVGGEVTCIAKAVCEKCEEEYGELAPHTGGEATCENKAVCSTCNIEYGEALGHNYGDFISNGNGTHSKVCFNDNGHKINEDCSGGTATETAKPVCSVCNVEYGSLLYHTHIFDKKVATDSLIKSSATCTEKAVYYYSCACGEKGTETFESGSALSHNYGVFSTNGNGTHSKTCANDNTHIITENCSGGTTTCAKKARCTTCFGEHGKLKEHKYTGLQYNEVEHWYECECGDKGNIESHIPGAQATETTDQVCTLCNYVLVPALGPYYTLKGKTIVNFGDSIFGKARAPMDISTFISELTDATVYNCGFGGCRMAKHKITNFDAFSMYRLAYAVANNDYSLQDTAIENGKIAQTEGEGKLPTYFETGLNLLKSIDFNKVDIVTIAYGTNDFTGNCPVENTEDYYDTEAFAGALRYSIETLLTAYPHLEIVVCSQTYRFWMDGEYNFTEDSDTYTNYYGNTLLEYVEKTEAVANEYQLPYIDCYYSLGINKTNYASYFPEKDGTHHSGEGRKLIAKHIADCLHNYYKFKAKD